jgi:hypothetical protein
VARDYESLSNERLLAALEKAGRLPDLNLIRACLDRQEELTPGLLRMLDQGIDDDWPEDDPRWYRAIHAALLLIAFREPAALPIFARILRSRDEGVQDLLEWFGSDLAAYGPAATQWAIDLLDDPALDSYPFSTLTNILAAIAVQHPSERERVLAALHAQLPPLAPDGTLALPPKVDAEQKERWAWVISALTDLKDDTTRPQVEALYRQGLVDESIIDQICYRSLLAPGAP